MFISLFIKFEWVSREKNWIHFIICVSLIYRLRKSQTQPHTNANLLRHQNRCRNAGEKGGKRQNFLLNGILLVFVWLNAILPSLWILFDFSPLISLLLSSSHCRSLFLCLCVCLCSVFIHHFLLFSPVLFFIIIIPFRVWSNDVFLCSIHSLNAPSGIKQAQLVSSFTFAFCLNDKKRARGIPLSVCVCVRLFVLIFSALLLITWFEPTVLPKRKANERRKEEEEAATLLPTNLLTRRAKIELGKMHKRINKPMNEKRTTNHQHIPALSRLVSKWNAACVFVCLFTLTWFGGVVSSRPVPPCLFFNVHYQHAQCIWF